MRDGADLIPSGASCVVFNATDTSELVGVSGDITVVQGFAPFVDRFSIVGVRVIQQAQGAFDFAVVLLPKSKKTGAGFDLSGDPSRAAGRCIGRWPENRRH